MRRVSEKSDIIQAHSIPSTTIASRAAVYTAAILRCKMLVRKSQTLFLICTVSVQASHIGNIFQYVKEVKSQGVTARKPFHIFDSILSLASFCERFQVSDLIHTMPWHRRIGSDFLFCIIVYNTWTKRVGNLDYESINFFRRNRYTVVKGGE